MRRPRHKLQVSTFPFLAVLLGAMGALILLLLVMDRRSKIVARNKALEIQAQQIAARAKKEDHHLQDEQARRADWERKCQEIHDLLREQEKELAPERGNLDSKLTALNQDLGKENKALSDLEKRLLEQRARLDLKNQLLTQMRQGIARSAKLDDAAQAEVEKLARDLAQLERILQETKALKAQKQETYSLVPYRGKLGEGRRPVYVECDADGLLFHPERQRLHNRNFNIVQFRAEVERRGIELVREIHDPERPSRPPTPMAATSPYVLFLVRPDGLDAYYNATTALRGFNLQFGYEFVDAQWALDFSQGAEFAGKQPPPRNDALRPSTPPTAPKGTYAGGGYPAPTGGFGAARSAVASGSNKGNGFSSSGNQSGSRLTGYPGFGGGQGEPRTGGGPRFGPVAATSAESSGSGSPFVATGIVANAGPPQVGTAAGLGLAIDNGLPGATAQGPGFRATLAGPGISPPPGGNNGSATAQTYGAGNQSDMQAYGPTNSGPISGSGQQPAGTGGNAGGPGNLRSSATTPGNSGGRQPGQVQADAQDLPWHGSQGAASQKPGTPTASAIAQGAGGQAGSGQGSGSGGDGGDPGSMGPLAQQAPNVSFGDPRPGPKKTAPAPSLGRLLANRDYILTIECFGDVVALYPSSQVFSAANNPNQQNIDGALVQAVLQLIARRQATVRSGEVPYRPLLRFQVHPDALRTYFHVYPLFENLHIPMARENLAS